MNNESQKAAFAKGLRDGVPICLGYISVSFAFGIFAVGSGLASWQAVLISAVNVTSAGQLAGVPIITGGLSFTEMALSQFVINMRYALMSISLSQKLGRDVRFIDRFWISFLTTDEIFAVSSGQKGAVSRFYLAGLVLTPFLGWTLGTALGAAAGNILPSIITNALGIAIYGMFIAIIMPVAKRSRAVMLVAVCASVLSVVFTFAPVLSRVSGGFAIIICAVTTSAVFAWLFPITSEEEDAANDASGCAPDASYKLDASNGVRAVDVSATGTGESSNQNASNGLRAVDVSATGGANTNNPTAHGEACDE